MNQQNIYELEQYFSEMIDKSVEDLRQDLLEKMSQVLQDLNDSPELQADLPTKITKVGGDFGSKTFNNLTDIASYAAISSVLPNFNAGARLPRGLDRGVVFRPALRRVGNLAGKTIAGAIFDTSGGRVNYGSNQIGNNVFAELFSGSD